MKQMKKQIVVIVLVALLLPVAINAQGVFSLQNNSEYGITFQSGPFTGILYPGDKTKDTYISSSNFVVNIAYQSATGNKQGYKILNLSANPNSSVIFITNSDIEGEKKPVTKPAQITSNTSTTTTVTKQVETPSTSTIIIKNEPKNYVTQRALTQLVCVINATNQELEGKTGALEGMMFSPMPDTTLDINQSNNGESICVMPNLFYDARSDVFSTGSGQFVPQEQVVKMVESVQSSIMFLKMPLGAYEDNLKYIENNVAYAATIQKMITENTRCIIITQEDLDRYKGEDRAKSRKLVNYSKDKILYTIAGENGSCPAARSDRNPGFSEMPKLSSGSYYLSVTYIKDGEMVTRDVLIMLVSTDRFVKVYDANFNADSWPGQSTLSSP